MQATLDRMPGRESKARRRDRIVGLGIVAAAFALALAISLWAKVKSRPETSAPPGPPTTEGVAGFPSRVDPVQALGRARDLTKRTVLRGFVASGVTSDGLVNVSEGPGEVRYSFQSPPGMGPLPPEEAGTRARRRFCGLQRVRLRKEGLVADKDMPETSCPPQQPDGLPEPRCSLADIWKKAIARGVPKDRPARIEYYRAKAGPAWRFDLVGTPHRFSVYGDCVRELTTEESVGYVP